MKRRIVKLGDVCEIKSGGTPSRSKPEYWKDGTIPWIKIGDINGKNVSSSSEFITNLGLNNSSTKLFKKGTVLYTIFATLGEVGILDIDATTNQAIAGILPPDELDKNYLYYFLKSKKDFVTQIGRGVAQNNINLSILRNFEIELLPIDHQIKIVNILDQAQELIDKRKAQIDALDELIKSVFYDMFGDPKYNKNHYNIVKIEDVCWKVTDGDHNTPIRENSGYLLLSARNVKNGYIDLSGGVDYVGQIEFDRMSKRCNPEEGDVLISCSGTIGRVTKVKIKDPFVLVRSVALLKPNDTINATFLENYLRTQYLQLLMYRNSSKSSQANLFNNKIKALPVMVPPIDIQNQFAEIVENIEKQKELLNRSLIELENNFNSLMQRAFKGELF